MSNETLDKARREFDRAFNECLGDMKHEGVTLGSANRWGDAKRALIAAERADAQAAMLKRINERDAATLEQILEGDDFSAALTAMINHERADAERAQRERARPGGCSCSRNALKAGKASGWCNSCSFDRTIHDEEVPLGGAEPCETCGFKAWTLSRLQRAEGQAGMVPTVVPVCAVCEQRKRAELAENNMVWERTRADGLERDHAELTRRIADGMADHVEEAVEEATRPYRMVLARLLLACEEADARGDLSDFVNGSLLDEARKALTDSDIEEARKETKQ